MTVTTPPNTYAAPGQPGAKVTFKPRYDHFIGGEYVAPAGGRYFENPSPVNGKVFTNDSFYPPSANGRILSSVPGGGWGWMQGTSMAGPHAAGVAALVRSTHPEWTSQQVIGALSNQADPLPCPKDYDGDGDGVVDAVCAGGPTGAGFYGAGLIDALDAVTK